MVVSVSARNVIAPVEALILYALTTVSLELAANKYLPDLSTTSELRNSPENGEPVIFDSAPVVEVIVNPVIPLGVASRSETYRYLLSGVIASPRTLPPPTANGDPDTAVRAPVVASTLYATTAEVVSQVTYPNLPSEVNCK